MAIVDDTDLELVRGDSEDFLITVLDEEGVAVDLSKAVDGTVNRPAIVRLAVKESVDDANSAALLFKSSYVESEVQLLVQTGATLGMARVLVDKPDTESVDPGTFRWDLEVTRQDVLRTAAGTISLDATATVVGIGTDFTKAKIGDVLQPLGATNLKPVKILSITSALALVVESAIFAVEPGIVFEIRRGKSRTAARGPIVLKAGVVAL